MIFLTIWRSQSIKVTITLGAKQALGQELDRDTVGAGFNVLLDLGDLIRTEFGRLLKFFLKKPQRATAARNLNRVHFLDWLRPTQLVGSQRWAISLVDR